MCVQGSSPCLRARLVACCSDLRWGKAWNHSFWQPHLALFFCPFSLQVCSWKQTHTDLTTEGRAYDKSSCDNTVVITEIKARQFTSRRNMFPKAIVCVVRPFLMQAFLFFIFRLCPAGAEEQMNARPNKQSLCSLYRLCWLFLTTAQVEIMAYSKC